MDYPHGLPKWTTLNYLPSKKKKRFLKLGCSSIDSRKYCARSPPSCFINAAGQLFCRRIHSSPVPGPVPGWLTRLGGGGGGGGGGGWYSSEFLVPNFRPKYSIFHTRFQTWPLKSIPVFRPLLYRN